MSGPAGTAGRTLCPAPPWSLARDASGLFVRRHLARGNIADAGVEEPFILSRRQTWVDIREFADAPAAVDRSNSGFQGWPDGAAPPCHEAVDSTRLERWNAVEAPCGCAGSGDMGERTVLAALAAPAHETWLAVFRMLVARGPSGPPAGETAERVGVPASAPSFHPQELDRAGLLRSRCRQLQMFYAADFEGTRGLLTFPTRDCCCQGRPEICGDLARLASVPEPEEA